MPGSEIARWDLSNPVLRKWRHFYFRQYRYASWGDAALLALLISPPSRPHPHWALHLSTPLTLGSCNSLTFPPPWVCTQAPQIKATIDG